MKAISRVHRRQSTLDGSRVMHEKQILATLSQQLSWSHLIELIPIKDPLAREFYAEMGLKGTYSERYLENTILREIEDMLLELDLRWLDKHERASGEDSPIGLILCASADAEQVELLHQAIEHAREQNAQRPLSSDKT